jgi:hypothetical protein
MEGVKFQLRKTDLKLSNQPSENSETETKKHKRDIPPYLKLVK